MVRRVLLRTCVGCRERAPASELLRVVVVGDALIPDPARRLPGRGAYLHPDPACLALAERRRAFGRALRVPGARATGVPDTGVLDPGPLTEHLRAAWAPPGTTDGGA